jgi:hypothetical protein
MPAMRGAFGVLAIIAGCGDGVGVPDAAMGSDDSVRGLVRVHVEGPSQGFEQVFFQNADSSIALVTRTNEVGDASALMAPGGFVTVVDEAVMYTWAGVQPGDELTLDLTFEEFNDVFPSATVRIDPLDGATDYFLFSRCESFRDVRAAIDEPFAPFFQPCTLTTDLMLFAWDLQIGRPLGYRYLSNASLLSAATIDLRGEYLPIDTNVDVIGPNNRTISIRQKLSNLAYTADTSAQINDTHVVVPTEMPVIPGTTVQTIARTFSFSFPKEDDAFSSERASIAWGPGSAMTTMDLTTPALRDITSTPELDLSSYTLRWTESEGVGGDVVWVAMGIGAFNWKVIGARTDETFLRLPVLPQDDLRPSPDSFFISNFALVATEGGYDRLRPYLLGHWNPSDGVWWPMKEPSGRVNYRSLF